MQPLPIWFEIENYSETHERWWTVTFASCGNTPSQFKRLGDARRRVNAWAAVIPTARIWRCTAEGGREIAWESAGQ